jgi:Deltex C-terminal domain
MMNKSKFSFQSGHQGSEHPSPGKQFYAVGFPRVCFIPASDLGWKVLSTITKPKIYFEILCAV